MIFKLKEDKYYPEFFVNDNKKFVIGLQYELFKRLKIQVMFTEEYGHPERVQYHVIKEYVSYERSFIDAMLESIKVNLVELSDDCEWSEVEKVLPKNDKKYLED